MGQVRSGGVVLWRNISPVLPPGGMTGGEVCGFTSHSPALLSNVRLWEGLEGPPTIINTLRPTQPSLLSPLHCEGEGCHLTTQ